MLLSAIIKRSAAAVFLSDRNGDERLSEEEFAAIPGGEQEKMAEVRQEELGWVQERRKEFRDAVDADKDGFASLSELLAYSNPRHPQHAKSEVRDLIEIADSDQDGQLSLEEVLAHPSLFFGSGLVNAARNMHDEF